jgi:hypothetical protein
VEAGFGLSKKGGGIRPLFVHRRWADLHAACDYAAFDSTSTAVKCLKLEDTSFAVLEQQKAKEEEGHREIVAERLERDRTDAINKLADGLAQQQPQPPEWMPMFSLRNGNVVFQGAFQRPQQFQGWFQHPQQLRHGK